MGKIKIIGLGALNLDRLYQVERIVEDGETVVQQADSFAGGSAANTIYGLAKLGVSTGFIGAVGDDEEGEKLIEDFLKVSVDTGQIRVKADGKTGTVLCLSDNSGRRSLYVMPGANSLLKLEDLDFSYLNQAEILHLTSFAGEEQLRLELELARKLDPRVSLSFSPGALYASKGLEALKPLLARASILFANQGEIHKLTGEDFARGAEICIQAGCQTVAVTLGEGIRYKNTLASTYIKDEKGEYLVEARSRGIKVVDTTGAGDAFAAGFLYGRLSGKGLRECGRLGDTVAEFCIGQPGAREGLPSLAQLARRYQERYSQPL